MDRPLILVVDDFLDDPDAVRRIALAEPFVKMHSAGVRTLRQFLHLAPYRERFEELLGQPLTNWDDNDANGRFQCCFAADAIPYHSDSQCYAGVLFLTPDAPLEAGISFLRSHRSGLRRRSNDPDLMRQTFGDGAEFDLALADSGPNRQRVQPFGAVRCAPGARRKRVLRRPSRQRPLVPELLFQPRVSPSQSSQVRSRGRHKPQACSQVATAYSASTSRSEQGCQAANAAQRRRSHLVSIPIYENVSSTRAKASSI